METVKDKLSDNELIAKFMGLPAELVHDTSTGTFTRKIDYEEYFKEWNNIMPVVEKIESLEFYSEITRKGHNPDGYRCKIAGILKDEKFYYRALEPTRIEAVYKAVLAFIEWYNKQGSPTPSKVV